MRKKILYFLRDESGQTSTEYILLVAVVAMVVFKFKDVIINQLTGSDGAGGVLGDIFKSDAMSKLRNLE